jgi:hypothetical protein
MESVMRTVSIAKLPRITLNSYVRLSGNMTGITFGKTNMCKHDGPMSVCLKPKDTKGQENCIYHEKASQVTRCMYLVFDEYCDNYWAQMGKLPPGKEEEKKEEKEEEKKAEISTIVPT